MTRTTLSRVRHEVLALLTDATEPLTAGELYLYLEHPPGGHDTLDRALRELVAEGLVHCEERWVSSLPGGERIVRTYRRTH